MSDVKVVDLKVSGDLYYSSSDDPTITQVDGTNGTSVITEYEALTWTSTGFIGNFNYTTVFENEETIYAGNCSVGTYAKLADRKYNLEAEFIKSADDSDFLADIFGGYAEDRAGTPVAGANQVEASGDWGYNDPFKIDNQNADGSAVTITSVTGGTDGLLVADTDYFVGQNADGDTIITIIDSTTVTTEAQTMTVVYGYTPSAGNILSYNAQNSGITLKGYKFISCPYRVDDATNPRQRDYIYFNKTALGGELVDTYLKTGETFAPATLSLSGDTGGVFVKETKKGATKASV